MNSLHSKNNSVCQIFASPSLVSWWVLSCFITVFLPISKNCGIVSQPDNAWPAKMLGTMDSCLAAVFPMSMTYHSSFFASINIFAFGWSKWKKWSKIAKTSVSSLTTFTHFAARNTLTYEQVCFFMGCSQIRSFLAYSKDNFLRNICRCGHQESVLWCCIGKKVLSENIYKLDLVVYWFQDSLSRG